MSKYAPARADGLRPWVVTISEWGRKRERIVWAETNAAAKYEAIGRQRYVYASARRSSISFPPPFDSKSAGVAREMECACGCGAAMKPRQRFVKGHNRRSSIESRITVRDMGHDTPCWIWPTENGHGYPAGLHHGGRRMVAHRAVYIQRVGPIPDGLQVRKIWQREGRASWI